MSKPTIQRTKAQESRQAIERLYIVMRHLFYRGYYKPLGASGQALLNSLRVLSPEIYGSMNDTEKVELDGLVYVIDRLPKGIEECRFVKLTSEEGYEHSTFEVIVPSKRRRNCYRVDRETMCIEVTRGRSEIYDILTHLTFMYNEALKIKNNATNEKGLKRREWEKLEDIVLKKGGKLNKEDREVAFTYLSTLLGRTYEETENAYLRLESNRAENNGLYQVVYWLGKLAIISEEDGVGREVSFTSTLRERIGHHIYGEQWADRIKSVLAKKDLLSRPIHIISANLHSVVNSIYAKAAISEFKKEEISFDDMIVKIAKDDSGALQNSIYSYANKNGLTFIESRSGTNLSVQIIDTSKLPLTNVHEELGLEADYIKNEKPVIFVMDYAFGEQAFETMDELLKPYYRDEEEIKMNIASISIMGKAGILEGDKGDIMIPNAHIFEGTTDNYPFKNDLAADDFKDEKADAFEGPMVTVLGTSLQNKDILQYFKESSWKSIGLEMEGAHYQKAIQLASKIRGFIKEDVVVRYAYYASDNPLLTGKTLASGSLGMAGVRPTYLITKKILQKVFKPAVNEKNNKEKVVTA
ncbi:hypothetical protein OO013_03790 [Mangrovivirga sp. M17]|uniref:Uncharacterized protein n=1 Tax=Mangrovivirga halotolerans TaxID=2993936 RepID=A0ABT3RNC5_9BACT|nr:hypothetical protein [Mangrovivirga halotolerans]MCX2742971.1 hypothetical protein [Mangrovivirga halotolerans]